MALKIYIEISESTYIDSLAFKYALHGVEYIYQATSPKGNIMHLYWKFSNEYVFNHTLTTTSEAYSFAYRTGLTSHPDIIAVWIIDGDQVTMIFRKPA